MRRIIVLISAYFAEISVYICPMKRLYYPLFMALLWAAAASAQTKLFVRQGCAVDDTEMGRNHYVFEPSNEAQQIINTIMEANLLDANFTIKSGDVDNALATFDSGRRYIIYNTAYIERIKSSTGTDWAAYYVFSHEIGHHLNGHTFDLPDEDSRKENELKADIFAGGMLYRLGAPLEEAQRGVETVCKEHETATHPPRRARKEAVANGWRRAKEKSPVQPKPVVLPSSSPTAPVADTAVPEDQPDLVFIQGGAFKMGSEDGDSDEKPVHTVTLSDFYLGKYEVTVGEFRRFVEDEGYKTDAEKAGSSRAYEDNKWVNKAGRNWRHDPEGNPASENYPVINVNWNDAVAYCVWMSKKSGQTYRLPTEAEWEYAAGNGPKHTKFSWGNGDPTGKCGGSLADEQGAVHFEWPKSISNIFVGYNDGYSTTAPVGSFKANELGLQDMTGNVWEWCSDWYGSDYYTYSPSANPKGATSGSVRVMRGGSWGYSPQNCRVANRGNGPPSDRYSCIGFRLARTK